MHYSNIYQSWLKFTGRTMLRIYYAGKYTLYYENV